MKKRFEIKSTDAINAFVPGEDVIMLAKRAVKTMLENEHDPSSGTFHHTFAARDSNTVVVSVWEEEGVLWAVVHTPEDLIKYKNRGKGGPGNGSPKKDLRRN